MTVAWTQPLTRTLILKSGERLKTLHDAADAFLRRFGNVDHDDATAHAITLMIRAAETGARADRKAATDQVALVLRINMLLRWNR